MTLNDPRVVDLTALERPVVGKRADSGGDLHLLRLALDLQLDAMLLTLGAAAGADSQGEGAGGDVPWRRWLVEDLELARTLATALLDGDAAPIPGLGGGVAVAGPEISLEHLVARYSSMEDLLCDVLARPQVQPWRSAASDALTRCRRRLAELHQHRRELIVTSTGSRTFLPGELLG